MNRFNLELSVGVFVLLGLLAMAYISIRLGQIPPWVAAMPTT